MTIKLQEYLEGATLEFDSSGEITDQDIRIACLVLLVQAANSDASIDSLELQGIINLSAREFDVNEAEVSQIFEVAKSIGERGGDLSGFVGQINERFDSLQKQLLLVLVWRVILANNKIEKLEAVFAAKLRTELNLTMMAAIRARKLADHEIQSLLKLKEQIAAESASEE